MPTFSLQWSIDPHQAAWGLRSCLQLGPRRQDTGLKSGPPGGRVHRLCARLLDVDRQRADRVTGVEEPVMALPLPLIRRWETRGLLLRAQVAEVRPGQSAAVPPLAAPLRRSPHHLS
jgi:hypothetical protein